MMTSAMFELYCIEVQMHKRIQAVFISRLTRALIISKTSINIDHEDERDNEHKSRLVLIHAMNQRF